MTTFAKTIFDSDPQRNVIFDLHVYGQFSDGSPASWQDDLATSFNALAATGLVFVIGEFGPGRNIGPSPTLITPSRVIQLANSHSFGWLAWAWDDNNLDGGMADDTGFSMTYSPGSSYSTSNGAELTIFGRDVVENASYGIKATAVQASIFP